MEALRKGSLRDAVALWLRLALGVLTAAARAAGAAGPTAPDPGARGGERRAAVATADVMRLQSELLALTDTALARVTAETDPGTLSKDPAIRRFSIQTRLALGTALLGIVTGPDPVDALLDMLTHTTLVADAMRNQAQGKSPDSPQARVLKALELNEADAWKLAERWLTASERSELRERIRAWPGERQTAAGVAYARLSDLPRGGATSATAAGGMVDSLRAAVQQTEQARLLGERALFLTHRVPYTLRWQVEALMYNTLAMDETQRLLGSIDSLSDSANSAVREIGGMPAQLSQERAAALQDLFVHFERERQATLEQMASILEKERKATLVQASDTVTAQRRALIEDLTNIGTRAEERGREWGTTLLVVLAVLITAVLVVLFGMLLLYRRLLQRMERHPPSH
jgi:hypothetical protein